MRCRRVAHSKDQDSPAARALPSLRRTRQRLPVGRADRSGPPSSHSRGRLRCRRHLPQWPERRDGGDTDERVSKLPVRQNLGIVASRQALKVASAVRRRPDSTRARVPLPVSSQVVARLFGLRRILENPPGGRRLRAPSEIVARGSAGCEPLSPGTRGRPRMLVRH